MSSNSEQPNLFCQGDTATAEPPGPLPLYTYTSEGLRQRIADGFAPSAEYPSLEEYLQHLDNEVVDDIKAAADGSSVELHNCTPRDDGIALSTLEASRRLKVSRTTLNNWFRDGCPRNQDGTVNLLEVDLWRWIRASTDEAVKREANRTSRHEPHVRQEAEGEAYWAATRLYCRHRWNELLPVVRVAHRIAKAGAVDDALAELNGTAGRRRQAKRKTPTRKDKR